MLFGKDTFVVQHTEGVFFCLDRNVYQILGDMRNVLGLTPVFLRKALEK